MDSTEIEALMEIFEANSNQSNVKWMINMGNEIAALDDECVKLTKKLAVAERALSGACDWGMRGCMCNLKKYSKEEKRYVCPKDKECPQCWVEYFKQQAADEIEKEEDSE